MRRVIGALGRSFVTVGILILLFVAYQLWGTGIYTSCEQERLREEFTSSVKSHEPSPTVTTGTNEPAPTVTTTTLPPVSAPETVEGDPIGILTIPKIGANDVVVEGIERDDLRKGPGHYPLTPLPGQVGNSAIAGHRTTYGAPFGDLDQITTGDKIMVETVQGRFTYEVYEEPLIIDPGDIGVLDPDPNRPATLTLTTCNPKYSASQRLVIKAELQREPLPAPPQENVPKLQKQGLSGEDDSKMPTVIAGAIVALIGGLWWLMFHRYPRWFTWMVGAVPFAIALFFFYVYLERILPANY